MLDNTDTNSKSTSYEKVSFGFYNFLILFVVVIIALSKGLHFFQDFIILNNPIVAVSSTNFKRKDSSSLELLLKYFKTTLKKYEPNQLFIIKRRNLTIAKPLYDTLSRI